MKLLFSKGIKVFMCLFDCLYLNIKVTPFKSYLINDVDYVENKNSNHLQDNDDFEQSAHLDPHSIRYGEFFVSH